MSRFGLRLISVRRRAKRDATEYLHKVEARLGWSFDAPTFHKIVKSHSVYLPIVNDAFTALHGRYTTEIEQERSIHYFTCSSLFDNFLDDRLLTLEQVENIVFHAGEYEAASFDERAFMESQAFVLIGMKEKDAYALVARKVFDAQLASLKQFDVSISNEKIQEITFAKGGNSVLLCRYYLDINPTKEEEQCWYLLGTMIQLSNDLFDIYKDTQQNIQTLATRCIDAYAIEKIFLEQVNKMRGCIHSLPYSKTRKQHFSIAMAATYSLGLVAIAQLKTLQGSEKTLPSFGSLPRKALIIDMEKPKNIWLWLKFVYRYAKL